MARIQYVNRETIPEGRADLLDRLLAERGPKPENIFLALANVPDLAEAVLGMATALRKRTALPKVFRELAVVTVGLETGATYELEHHRNAALAAGIRREQLEHLREFETAVCFTEQERAVIRLAKETTVSGRVQDTTWPRLAFLGTASVWSWSLQLPGTTASLGLSCHFRSKWSPGSYASDLRRGVAS